MLDLEIGSFPRILIVFGNMISSRFERWTRRLIPFGTGMVRIVDFRSPQSRRLSRDMFAASLTLHGHRFGSA
jgi:hypothetical protein